MVNEPENSAHSLALLLCEVYGGVDDERAKDRERAREERERAEGGKR